MGVAKEHEMEIFEIITLHNKTPLALLKHAHSFNALQIQRSQHGQRELPSRCLLDNAKQYAKVPLKDISVDPVDQNPS